MKPLVYIRADGSHTIGLGHLTRCLALAHMLKENFEVVFFCMEIPPAFEVEFSNSGFKVTRIKNENEFLPLIKKGIIVVLDGYTFTSDYQRDIKKTGCSLVYIDDMVSGEYVADLIINQNPGVSEKQYLAKPSARFAIGLEYALLRPLFLEKAKDIQKTISKESVFVCFGGSDIYNLTEKVVAELMEYSKLKSIIVVTGSAYSNSENIFCLRNRDSRIDYLQSLSEQEMVKAMSRADFAIVPASGILLEVLACGCIPITCFFVDNQKLFHDFAVDKYKIDSFGDCSKNFPLDEFKNKMDDFMKDSSRGYMSDLKFISSIKDNVINQFISLYES